MAESAGNGHGGANPAGRPRWATGEGSPSPLGVSWVSDERAYNFALYSRFAETVTLLFYVPSDVTTPVFRYVFDPLRNKSGRIWHCRISEHAVPDAAFYAYSIDGPPPAGQFEWHHFDPDKILLDPYATTVVFPPGFDRSAAIRPGSNAGRAPLAHLRRCACDLPFDWTGDTRPHHEGDTIIYELHVRAFTQHHTSGLGEDTRGTYAGLIEKIPYLQELGVTAVELMPVFQYDPQEGSAWGYMPLNLFAPHHEYAAGAASCTQADEFKRMVRALHAADIEVLLDVVYNHTAEGNQAGPTYSYKGIDNSTYYAISTDPSAPYEDFAGVGNSIHSPNRAVRKMILDSLRYWVTEMHVDGFRFDLASVFSRNSDGSINLTDPMLFADIMADPTLAERRLIAEPWDAVGVSQLGRAFPALSWLQWNSRFRDDVRRFVRTDPGLVGALMYRLYGSDDLFPGDVVHAFHPYQSVNYVTAHDGFTLYDLVAYNERRNWANGEENRDGPAENFSWNCGWEGDEGVPADVMLLRRQQVKNFCCQLMLSNGTPMFRAGDEFMQTQGGNSNPYNQDNDTTWLDWRRLETNRDIFRFFKLAIAFRKAHASVGRSRFWRHDVEWHGVDAGPDLSPDSHCLGFYLSGAPEGDDDLYVMINASEQPRLFTVQAPGGGAWLRVVDTCLDSPADFRDPGEEAPQPSRTYDVGARATVVLIRRRGDQR
ncbi:MAG: isoamylase [Acidobacteria bacterium]|nr:isoamylase [Acidobacteriota bacterium]